MKRVLVVDDEPMIRQLVSDFLTEAGYFVSSASNGSEALRTMNEHKPDAVVLDLMMPTMDGSAFVDLTRLNPRYTRVPVIVITAAYNAAQEAARVGAQACLPKPFELEELAETLARLIGNPENMRLVGEHWHGPAFVMPEQGGTG